MKSIKYILLFLVIISSSVYAISKIPYSHENVTREEFEKTFESMERRMEFFFNDDTLLASNSEIKNIVTIVAKRMEENGLIVDIKNNTITDKITGKEYHSGRTTRE